MRAAAIFLAAQLGAGLLVLLQFNLFTIGLGAASLALVATYPFMKRITYWPQAFLGLTFNWGALLGWAAVSGGLAWPAGLLYAGGIAWTLGYDTIYAHQDKEDDAPVGIKSLALKFGSATRPYLYAFYAAAIALAAASGWAEGLAWPFYALLAAGAVQLAWQARGIDLDDPVDCLVKFKSNRMFGWLLFAAMIAGRVV